MRKRTSCVTKKNRKGCISNKKHFLFRCSPSNLYPYTIFIPFLFFGRKTKDAMAFIFLARTQQSRRPLRFVGRIGILLRFQTHRSTAAIDNSFLAFQRTVQEIAGIYLQTGFVGVNLKHDARTGRCQCGARLRIISLCVQHPIVVITQPVLQLLEIIVDAGTDGRGTTEIHRRTLNGQDFTGSHKGAVHGRIVVSINREQVVRIVA